MALATPGEAGILLRRRPRRYPAAALRVLCATLLAVVVAAGALEIHPTAESHEPLAGLAHSEGDSYFPAASHPTLPHHAESAREAQRPPCAICLNRLQNVGDRPAPAAHATAHAAGGALPIAAALAPLQRSLRPDGARAPPFTV